MQRYDGMVVGRTILSKGYATEISPALLRHELVHLKQIDQHIIATFYFTYVRDYLVNLNRLRNHDAAYRNIPLEKEACELERE